MSVDPELADRVRAAVAAQAGRHRLRTDERRMFGGLAFMVEGKMACGVVNDELMARVGPDRHTETLEHPHARPMDFTGRPVKGYVFVEPAGCRTDQAVEAWVALAIDYISTLIDTPPARSVVSDPRTRRTT